MSVFTDPIDFVSLYGPDGLGALVGVRDSTTDLAGRKNAINRANTELSRLKGFWRLRSFDYTSSSSPALAVGTRAYAAPSATNAVFDQAFRLYYRQAGQVVDVPFVSDHVWLEQSATRSTDAGYPDVARTVQTTSAVQIELNRPISQAFLDGIGTLTLEHFIRVPVLTNDTDTPILPANLRHLILPLAGYYYALQQGDYALAYRLAEEAKAARAEILRYDLTRTGRPRQLQPTKAYVASGFVGSSDYGAAD